MSLRLVSSCTRMLSPNIRRRIPSPMNSVPNCRISTTEKPPRPPKAASTFPKPVSEAAEQNPAVEKGDTYKAGETYFSFNNYSFYDIEKEMNPKRLKQPCSSEKLKIYCRDKLNPREDLQRRLLPEEYGYLVEWPGKAALMPKKYIERPVLPVIEGRYKMKWDAKADPYCRTRIPL